MANSITPDNMASKAKLQAQTQVQDSAKKSAPKDVNGYLQLLSDGLIEKGATKEEAKQFIEHPIVQKTTEKYVQSLAKNNANAKTGGGAGPMLNLTTRIMLAFSFTMTLSNDKLAALNKEQEAINKLLPELAKIIEEIKDSLGEKGADKTIKIPADLKAYIEKHGPRSYTGIDGKFVNKPLSDAIKPGASGTYGMLFNNKKNGEQMASTFSGMETALTTGNTTKAKLQSETQKNINVAKLFGRILPIIFRIGQDSARKL